MLLHVQSNLPLQPPKMSSLSGHLWELVAYEGSDHRVLNLSQSPVLILSVHVPICVREVDANER